jgi:hypothetical protein
MKSLVARIHNFKYLLSLRIRLSSIYYKRLNQGHTKELSLAWYVEGEKGEGWSLSFR